MSNLDPRPDPVELRASVVSAVDVIEARKAAIGDGTEVRRLLPTRELRTIGAWCFLDHYGPDDVKETEKPATHATSPLRGASGRPMPAR